MEIHPFDRAPTPSAVLRRFRPSTFLLLAGAPASKVYLLRSGQVRVSVPTEPGREATTAILGPGQLVGLAALLGQPVYHSFVRAITPVEAWSTPADELLALLPD